MARASASSLNARSNEPPPRPMMTTSSSGSRAMARKARTSRARPRPPARAGRITTRALGCRCANTRDVAQGSAVERGHDADAAREPAAAVCAASNSPSACRRRLSCSKASCGAPVRAARCVTRRAGTRLSLHALSRPRGTCVPSSGRNRATPLVEHLARICVVILEREIWSRTPLPAVGNLAFDSTLRSHVRPGP